MSRKLILGLYANDYEALALETEKALKSEGFQIRRLHAADKASRQRETLARVDLVTIFYPHKSEESLTMGIVAGLGKPLVVMVSDKTDRRTLPRGVQLANSMRRLLALIRRMATRLGKSERHVTPRNLEQYGACTPGIDWFKTHYPKGGPISNWSPEEQRRLLLGGGARWVRGAVRYGLIEFWPMSNESFIGEDLTLARLQRTQLDGSDFSDAILTRANLSNSDLTGARFEKTQMTGIRMRECSIKNATFTKATLNEAMLDRINGHDACFDEADCHQTSFRDSDLQGASFVRCSLQKAFFAGADLRKADFSQADLSYAYLVGSQLEGANFEGAKIDTATFSEGERPRIQKSPAQEILSP